MFNKNVFQLIFLNFKCNLTNINVYITIHEKLIILIIYFIISTITFQLYSILILSKEGIH